MPRLSEPMRRALLLADQLGTLRSWCGYWRPAAVGYSGRSVLQCTINALTLRGLLQHVGQDRVITPAGREAIGVKGGEDNV